MKINYNQNPMKTIVELDDIEKENFKLIFKVEELKERISSAYFVLNPSGWRREFIAKRLGREPMADDIIQEAIQYLDYDYIIDNKIYGNQTYEQHIDYVCTHYIKSIQEEHEGDCTCVAVSCPKCHAESLLGIDTLKGLGKHEGSKISWMFRSEQKGGTDKTINEVIENLRNYKPVNTNPNWPDQDFNLHIPRWNQEAKNALEWLIDYKATKLT